MISAIAASGSDAGSRSNAERQVETIPPSTADQLSRSALVYVTASADAKATGHASQNDAPTRRASSKRAASTAGGR
ncbi:MAG TPA: hypothetical protein VK778_16390 [Solirubrobacteraceae bacterium]|nr:hypothetical protein [Solirubrobacteraceae bacterium]